MHRAEGFKAAFTAQLSTCHRTASALARSAMAERSAAATPHGASVLTSGADAGTGGTQAAAEVDPGAPNLASGPDAGSAAANELRHKQKQLNSLALAFLADPGNMQRAYAAAQGAAQHGDDASLKAVYAAAALARQLEVCLSLEISSWLRQRHSSLA